MTSVYFSPTNSVKTSPEYRKNNRVITCEDNSKVKKEQVKKAPQLPIPCNLNINSKALDKIEPNSFYIGFTSGEKLLSELTRILTGTGMNTDGLAATHAVLVYANSKKELFVADCGLEQGGVQIQPFKNWVLAPQTKGTLKISLYPAQNFINPEKLSRIFNRDKPINYSLENLLWHGAIHLIPSGKLKNSLLHQIPSKDNSMICSELVAHCLKDDLLKGLGLPPQSITPANLENYLANTLGLDVIKLREEKPRERNKFSLKLSSLYTSAYSKSPYSL